MGCTLANSTVAWGVTAGMHERRERAYLHAWRKRGKAEWPSALWLWAGQKRSLRWLRHYLVSVTRNSLPGGVPSSTALHLYDLRNKLIAATLPLQRVGIPFPLCSWASSLFVNRTTVLGDSNWGEVAKNSHAVSGKFRTTSIVLQQRDRFIYASSSTVVIKESLSESNVNSIYEWLMGHGVLKPCASGFDMQEPRHVEVAWGQVVVVQADGGVAYLHEKELSAKLELLYSKSLYLVALNLATSEEVHPLHS